MSPLGAVVVRLLLLTILLISFTAVPAGRALAQDATGGPEEDATPVAAEGLGAAVTWLLGQQAEDGGFPGFDGVSDPGATCDAISALAAARAVGIEVGDAVESAYAFLETNALVYAQTGTGQSAKLVLASVAAGGDPRDVGGVLPLELVVQGVNSETGLYGLGVFDHALAMLALAAAGEGVPAAAIDALAATQLADGSWSFEGTSAEGAGDSNTTALVVQALVAAGQADSPLVQPAMGYLGTVQAETGAFAFQPANLPVTDANSTALAVQAFLALGMNPSAPDLLDAAGALATFQNESGAFRYNEETPDDNLFATVQAIPALAGLALPILPEVGMEATPAVAAR